MKTKETLLMIKNTPEFMRERTFETISKMYKKWFGFDLIKNIEKITKKKLNTLDVGGGKGIFAKTLKEKFRGKIEKSINCDFSPEEQNGVENISKDFFKYKFEEKFDYINAMASIDYMTDSISVIEKIANSLKTNGFATMYFMKKQSFIANDFNKIISDLKSSNQESFDIEIHSYENNQKPKYAFYDDGILVVIKKTNKKKFINNYKLIKNEKGLIIDENEDSDSTKKYRTFEPYVIRKFY